MTTVKKIVNKEVMLASVIVVAGILLSAVVSTSSSFGQLSAQQMVTNNNFSMQHNMPKINGSINVGQQIKSLFKENIKVPFTTAAEAAQKQIPNGTILGGHLGVAQGYLTYTYFVVDPTKETGHKVIVDAGNGKVLYTSEGIPIGSFGQSGHPGKMMFGPFGHGAFGPWKAH